MLKIHPATALTTVLDGILVVVETDDKAYLGTLHTQPDGRVAVRSGRVGHPPLLELEDIVAVTAAEQHPDVVFA